MAKHTQTEKHDKGKKRHLSLENVSASRSDDICGNPHGEGDGRLNLADESIRVLHAASRNGDTGGRFQGYMTIGGRFQGYRGKLTKSRPGPDLAHLLVC